MRNNNNNRQKSFTEEDVTVCCAAICSDSRVRSIEELPMRVVVGLDRMSRYTGLEYYPGEPLVPCTFYGGTTGSNLRDDPRFKRGDLTFIPEWIPLRVIREVETAGSFRLYVKNPAEGAEEISINSTNFSEQKLGMLLSAFRRHALQREIETSGC